MKPHLFILLSVLTPSFAFAAVFDQDLFFGVRNSQNVRTLQEFLTNQGVYSGPITGNFFSLTREGVKRFQEREKIVPAAGYFGPKTRARANIIAGTASGIKEEPKATDAITAKIKELQSAIQLLQDQEKQKSSDAVASSTDITPPIFVKKPYVSKAGFVTSSSLGVRYPYRVVLDWETDEQDLIESVACAPSPKTLKTGKSAEYYPEPNTFSLCTVTVKDKAGNMANADVTFSSPSWLNVDTASVSKFPEVATDPTKFGEFAVYNGSTTDVTFSNIEIIISEELDSTPNRNNKIKFLIRDGAEATDTLIGEKEFTFILLAPPAGNPHKSFLTLPFGTVIKKGEERKFSLWVEQFKFVKSGTLKITATKIEPAITQTVNGGFEFLLTKVAPL